MAHTIKSIYLDITGKRKPGLRGRVVEIEDSPGVSTPEEKVVGKTG